MNSKSVNSASVHPPPIKIAVVGDIHDQWTDADHSALVSLGVDLVLFVGDFGNESIPIVKKVAELPLPKAIAFGNHDAWYTATPWGQRRCPYNRETDDWFQQQLDILAPYHLNYRHLDFDDLNLSVVGGRPFSWGGPKWHMKEFYSRWFGVQSMEESRDRILDAIQETRHEHVIILSHNGPAGLGDQPEDMCGKDWHPMGGDYGDPELAEAIVTMPSTTKQLSLVAFGHMHHRLRHTQARLRTHFYQAPNGTIYLNAASVPRIQIKAGESCHHFALVTQHHHQIVCVESSWVTASGNIRETEVLFSKKSANAS